MGKEGYADTQGNWKWNSEFDKKGKLKENSIYSFKPIEDTEIETYQIKKNSIGVSESKILIDAAIPFQIKPWGYEEMKNPDEKVNIGAFDDAKKLYLAGRGYSPIRE